MKDNLTELILETPRMWLVACSIPLYEAILRHDNQIAEYLGIEVKAGWTEFGDEPSVYSMERVRVNPAEEPWWQYLAVHKADNLLIGAGGYKGSPNRFGVVEIGYEIMLDYRNQGYATEFAQHLINFAFSNADIKVVQAHTLAEPNASTHVLKRCGMDFVQEMFDTDDGTIWQWKVHRPMSIIHLGE
ncbi:MAG TPA: GNAT family N-acetyltransferase [Haliscomenobacter sp.]|nr:GNAT family N-acetyltransferase [Haliscomenobacter sp.]